MVVSNTANASSCYITPTAETKSTTVHFAKTNKALALDAPKKIS